MSSLPEAPMQAWTADAHKLGGLLHLAKLDHDDLFLPKSIKDHPWLNLEVKFPFEEIGKGKITNCITHPNGYLMFDVFFSEPVPPIHNREVALKDCKSYHHQWHRYTANELKEMCVLADTAA